MTLLLISSCASNSEVRMSASSSVEADLSTKADEDSVFNFSISDEQLEVPESEADFENNTRSYGGNGDLSFDDFAFYGDLYYNGVPKDAYYPAIMYAEGEWKYDLQIRYDSSDGYYFEEIGYADFILDYDKEVIVLKLHPRLAQDGYEVWEEDDDSVGYEPFEGLPKDGALPMYGNDCVLHIGEYYAYEGREYIYGTLWMSEEDSAVFLMYRGQN